MQITAEPREDYTILHLRGEFDTYYCPHLLQEIQNLQTAGVKRVVLNLRLVKFINSTALGAIIKASKTLQSAAGRMAIARPSAFVRDIMEKVGLDRVVPIFESDEEAGAHLLEARPTRAKAGSEEHMLEEEGSVLFSPADQGRVQHFIQEKARSLGVASGAWRGIGRMSGLDGDGLRFVWNGGNTGLSPFEMGQMLALGTELRVKFRLPLLQKGHCEALVTVNEVEERSDAVKIGARFSEIDAETQKVVERYAADLAFLKSELRKATE